MLTNINYIRIMRMKQTTSQKPINHLILNTMKTDKRKKVLEHLENESKSYLISLISSLMSKDDIDYYYKNYCKD
jgi:hypothetical protein